jgi:riboflavin biosynthesis pyrimidine reductase
MMQLSWPAENARQLGEHELEGLYDYPADRKWLLVNFVSSADGAVTLNGRAAGLSNEPDHKVLQLGSDLADVLLVGATTAMVEGFRGVQPGAETEQRRSRHKLAPIPPVAVVTTGRTLPAKAPVITEAEVPAIVLTCEAASPDNRRAWTDAGADVAVVGDAAVEPAQAIDALVTRGLRRIDCEGGPHLFGSLLAAGVVDELRLTVSPLLVSGSASRIAAGIGLDPVDLDLASAVSAGSTLMLRYLVQTPAS